MRTTTWPGTPRRRWTRSCVASSDNIAGMDAITSPPAPVNEPNLTYAPGTPEREELRAELARLERRQHTSAPTSAAGSGPAAAREIKVVQPHDHQHVLGTMKSSTTRDAEAAIKAATAAAPGWRAMSIDDRCRDPAQGRRPARRSVAPDAERRHHARPVEDGLPGRDRRGLRADRLLAVQRPLRPADPRPTSRSPTAPASGTAPTTGRSRASSTPSRRSTSPRSPATCRPRRR